MLSQSFLKNRTNPILAQLMFQPLEPSEFCASWVPKKTGKQPGEYGYREDCCILLSEVTEYGKNTCNNWLSSPEKCPQLVKMYLRVVDILWTIHQNVPIPGWLFKK